MERSIEDGIGRSWRDFIPLYGVFNYVTREENSQPKGKNREEGYLAAVILTQYAYVPIGMAVGAAIKSLIDLV